MIYMPILMAVIGLLYMLVKKTWVLKQDAGDGKMKEISDYIYEGALAFLKAVFYRHYSLVNSSSVYFWSYILCICWKYWDENSNKNEY